MIEIVREDGYQELQRDTPSKNLAAEIKKIKPLTSFSAASAQPGKDVEGSVNAMPSISFQDNLLETPAENLTSLTYCLKSSESSIYSAVDQDPEFNTEQQQALCNNIALVSDDPALWPE
jgi:hypothetical protein